MINFVKLYCDITEHWLWRDPIKLKWWIDLVILSQKPSAISKKGGIEIGITGLAKRWGASKPTVSRFVAKLRESGLLKTETSAENASMPPVKRIIVCVSESYTSERNIFEAAGETIDEVPKTLPPKVKTSGNATTATLLSSDQKEFLDGLKRDYPTVMAMQQPLTYEQCKKLSDAGYSSEQIRNVLSQMENYNDLRKKYKSAYLTASNWLRKK